MLKIKSEETRSKKEEINFPCLFKSKVTGSILLATEGDSSTNELTGTVIQGGGAGSVSVIPSETGEYSKGWDAFMFEPYYGQVTITQTKEQ